jgi:hypothetical protein
MALSANVVTPVVGANAGGQNVLPRESAERQANRATTKDDQ